MLQYELYITYWKSIAPQADCPWLLNITYYVFTQCLWVCMCFKAVNLCAALRGSVFTSSARRPPEIFQCCSSQLICFSGSFLTPHDLMTVTFLATHVPPPRSVAHAHIHTRSEQWTVNCMSILCSWSRGSLSLETDTPPWYSPSPLRPSPLLHYEVVFQLKMKQKDPMLTVTIYQYLGV